MSQETIGIIGAAGDLGRQLSIQVASAYERILAFDINPTPWPQSAKGIDLITQQQDMLEPPVWTDTAQELFDQADIIHWATRPVYAHGLEELTEGQLLIFHSSVMDLSQTAVNKLRPKPGILGKMGAVHCLMNDYAMVMVAEENEANDRVTEHLDTIGMEHIIKPIDECDYLMAWSQGIMAVQHELIADHLKSWQGLGLLTPSGGRYESGLASSAAKWTPETYEDVRHNRQLHRVIAELFIETNGRPA